MATRVLLIDDDTRMYELLAQYLGQNGITVAHAPDGGRGLAALEANAYDAVLLDVMMPGMDGLEVCKSIRAKQQIPIIMLTARGAEPDRVVGLELGGGLTRVIVKRVGEHVAALCGLAAGACAYVGYGRATE